MKFSAFSLMQWPEDRSQSEVFHNELEQLTRAESQGYYGAWLAEHHFSRYGIGPAIHLTAANLAARTSTIKIGTAITILPFMHPLRVAEEVAMLDILSEGRIEWGVGRGYQGHEFDGFGVDIKESHKIFYEQLDVIKLAWTGEPFSHHGEFYNFDELQCFPNPIQDPAPPIYIAALSPSTIEWAAQNRYPVLADQFSPTKRLESNRTLYRDTAASVGFNPDEAPTPTLRHVYVGETMAKAREEAAAGLLWYYRSLAQVGSPGGKANAPVPENYSFYRVFGEDGFNPDKDPDGFLKFLFDECTIVGDAAYCRERVSELRERIGLEHLICWQNFGGLAHEQTMSSQKRLIEEVAPAFA
ncbi:MAG: LLM class flavin-dependent oxidoreductase [Myxococcota bacterium]|jgi:alkanesulfonate monooxygenase SsuD/methylene tetrahydromethanopterin reductase-like flavin-dependent oxidoreductase (luciferase family)|nr:LLM class flavin-dependent oxidoreductase [Myxococcota bacterium]